LVNDWAMASARESHTAILLTDGKVLVMSGYSIATASLLASSELYDPVAGVWMATGTLSTARVGHTSTLLTNGKVLVTGEP